MGKNPLRKGGKKWKQLARKTTAQAKLKLDHYLHQVFIKNMSLKKLQKMLRKSPALNARATIFKNADFCLGSLKVTKLGKF